MMKAFCKCMGLAVLAAAMFAACTVEELPVDEPVIEEPTKRGFRVRLVL